MYISAVLEKKYSDSADTMVILLSDNFLMCLAAVTPAIPFPIITTCSMAIALKDKFPEQESFLEPLYHLKTLIHYPYRRLGHN